MFSKANSTSSFKWLSGSCLSLVVALAGCSSGSGSFCDNNLSPDCTTKTGPPGVGGAGNAGTASSTGGVMAPLTTVLHVEGPLIKNEKGETVILRGVNRSGSEYKCTQTDPGNPVFDGRFDDASVKAIVSWKANTVRVPLNEQCWLGINGLPSVGTANGYKTAIKNYVTTLHNNALIPILELHWAGPAGYAAKGQLPMPDADHATDFWRDVATTFNDDLGVILELYNEPFPDSNRDTVAGWACWRDGCSATGNVKVTVDGGTTTQSVPYTTVGFQSLVNTVRSESGAKNLILLGGVQYSNTLSRWSEYKPTDSENNLGAAWHIYNFNACATTVCFDGVPATLAQTTLLAATEIGENDCQGSIVEPWMAWFDSHQVGYLAWTWNAYGACAPAVNGQGGQPWSLIANFSGTPNAGLGQAFHDHLANVVP